MTATKTQQNIPSGWKQAALSTVSDIIMGQSPDSSSYNKNWEGLPFFQGKADFTDSYKTIIRQWTSEPAKIAEPADTLISVRAPVGDIARNNVRACIGRGLAAVRAKKQIINQEYLFYVLQSLKTFFNTKAQGSTFTAINGPELKKISLLLPPIKEQQKIAGILGAVDEDIAKTQEVIEATEKLKRGLMQNILSFGNKDGVKHLAFGDIGKVSMCKRIFKEETSNEGDIPFYKIGTFGGEPDSFISQEIYDKYRSKFSFPKIGDILLSASGTIGRKVIYDGRPAYFQDSNIIWLEHDESKILNSFLFHLYDTIKWQTEGSTIKRLYNDIFLRKIIPVPSIDKQRQIVEILSVIDEKIMVNRKLEKKLTLLKKGLMQDLLSGKVRTS